MRQTETYIKYADELNELKLKEQAKESRSSRKYNERFDAIDRKHLDLSDRL